MVVVIFPTESRGGDKVKESGDRVRYRSQAATPYFKDLNGRWREWVGGIIEVWDLERKDADLADTEKAINRTLRTRDEARELLRLSFESYRSRYINGLTKFLNEQFSKNSKDPLSRAERLEFLAHPLLPFKDLEEAFEAVPDSTFSKVKETARASALADTRRERERVRARLAELRCPPFIAVRGGEVVDIRQKFTDGWMVKQRECREACDPQGFDLRTADPDCRWAYEQLKIHTAIAGPKGLLPALRD